MQQDVVREDSGLTMNGRISTDHLCWRILSFSGFKDVNKVVLFNPEASREVSAAGGGARIGCLNEVRLLAADQLMFVFGD